VGRRASSALHGLAPGQINMRKVKGWQTLATKPIDQPIDLAA
jgi:putative transposase